MSKEVSLFRDEKNVAVGSSEGLDEITRSLLGGASYKRIRPQNGKFCMVVNGQVTTRSPDSKMDVVVVNAAPAVSRHWYAQNYDGNAVAAPDCWSNDGVKPDARSAAPQCSNCQACPKNEIGSGSGGKGRACRFSRRMAVVLANDIEHSDIYQINLAATSLFGKAKTEDEMPLDAYVKQLAGFSYSITGVVTEMRFDEGASVPKLFFRGVKRLTPEQIAIVKEKGQSPEALAAISFNPGQIDRAALNATQKPKVESAPAPLFRDEDEDEPKVRVSKKEAPIIAKDDLDDIVADFAEDTDD